MHVKDEKHLQWNINGDYFWVLELDITLIFLFCLFVYSKTFYNGPTFFLYKGKWLWLKILNICVVFLFSNLYTYPWSKALNTCVPGRWLKVLFLGCSDENGEVWNFQELSLWHLYLPKETAYSAWRQRKWLRGAMIFLNWLPQETQECMIKNVSKSC